MIKKLLMAIAAMAMSFATVAVVSVAGPSVAGAAAPPPTTISCASTGTFSFAAPGSSAGGALTANATVKGGIATTPTGTGCSGLPISVGIVSPTTACPQTGGVPTPTDPAACLASKTKAGVTTYAIATKPNVYDTATAYASSGLTDLGNSWQAKAPKTTVDNIPVTLNFGSAAAVAPAGLCGSTDVGFDIKGNAELKGLVVGTFDDLVCISGDAGTGTTGNFLTDLFSPTAIVTSGTVGGNSALTVVFPSENCTISGSVAFAAPGLSAGGALTANTTTKATATTTPTGTGCSGLPGSVSIVSPTTACPQTGGVPTPTDPAACLASKTKLGVTTYAIALKPNYYDTGGSFSSAQTITDLAAALTAKPPKTTVDNVPVTLNYGTAAQVLPGGVCGANGGFLLTGNAELKGLTVGTYTDTACLSGDVGTGTSGNFITDLFSPTAVITSGVIGGASVLTVTF